MVRCYIMFFFFSSRRRHTRWTGDWSSDVCSSDLRRAAPRELGQHRPVNRLDELLDLRLADAGDRRVGAHPARVRPGVALADPLEVLRRRERRRLASVAQHEEGDLLALEKLFDQQLAAER